MSTTLIDFLTHLYRNYTIVRKTNTLIRNTVYIYCSYVVIKYAISLISC